MIKTKHLWLQFNHSPFFIWGKGRRSCSNGQQAKSSQDKILTHPNRREMHPKIKIYLSWDKNQSTLRSCLLILYPIDEVRGLKNCANSHEAIFFSYFTPVCHVSHVRPSCPSATSVMSVTSVRHIHHIRLPPLSCPSVMSVHQVHLSRPSVCHVHLSVTSICHVRPSHYLDR